MILRITGDGFVYDLPNERVTEADTFDPHDFSLAKFFKCHTNNDCYAINTDDTDGSKRKKHPH